MANGIDLADFYFLNPGVDKTCSNLWLNGAYCVQAVGNIATYPNYPVSVPPTSFARPTTTQSSTSTTSAFTLPTLPLAVGSYQNCLEYARGVPGDEPAKAELNTCSFMANAYKVSVDNLLKWNPSLSRASCIFSSKVRYCVSKDRKSGMFSHEVFFMAHTNVLRIPY